MKKLTLALGLALALSSGGAAIAAEHNDGARGVSPQNELNTMARGWGRGGFGRGGWGRGPGYGWRGPGWRRGPGWGYGGYYCPLPQRILGLCW